MNAQVNTTAALAITQDEQAKITQSVYHYLTKLHQDSQNNPIPNSSLMDLVFEQLDVSYPHKWRSAYPAVADREMWLTVWAERFALERIDNDRIKLALNQVERIKTGFVPTLDEFVRASRPVVDHAAAYAYALRQWKKRFDLKTKDDWDAHNLAYVKGRALWAAACDMQDAMDAQKEYNKIKLNWILVLDEMLARDDLPPVPPMERPKVTLTMSAEAKREYAQPIIGLSQPKCPDATEGELELMLHTVRQLYRSLRRAFVDIAPDDALLKAWIVAGDADTVIRRALSVATMPNSRLMRFMWYTPQQMGLVRQEAV